MPGAELLAAIRRSAANLGPVRLMEVCGTHTVAIAKAALKDLLPANVTLLSGPGCPVCVTSERDIAACVHLARLPGVLLASYGDMLRVPAGGDSLLRQRALGADVRMVYSPLEAVALARENPEKTVVFLAVGFETTAPGTAVAVETAVRERLGNFFVYPLLKRVEPALLSLAAAPDFRVDGLLCPGHVASVVGAAGFAYVETALQRPAVIAGFTPEDILLAIRLLLEELAAGETRLINAYPRAVRPAGNPMALAAIDRVFRPCDAVWRGLEEIPQSGLMLRDGFCALDARRRFDLGFLPPVAPSACQCGAVLRGALAPRDCPLFGQCTPEDPLGPCMVSEEGSCAAVYKYGQ